MADLDRSRDELAAGRIETGLADLELALGACRAGMSRSEWYTAATGPLRRHDISALLREDPLTALGATRPRGGAGEAAVFDLLFDASDAPPVSAVSPRAARIHAVTTGGDTGHGWRWRRQFLADAVRRMAEARDGVRILTIGAGHVREADLLAPDVAARIGEWVVVDHDAAALVSAMARHPGVPLRAIPVSARDILTGQLPVAGAFDLVYAPGFFDLLTDGMALVLAQRLLERCASGGRLLIPNATDDVADAPYFEVWLDWATTPRSEAGMLRLLDGASATSVARSHTVTRDPRGTTVCLDVERA
jgi:hypothetical protein